MANRSRNIATGLVIGKFHPFHSGHSFLISTAEARVDKVIVLVCEHPDQVISGATRAEWIQATHPKVTVKVIPDIVPPDDSAGWAKYTIEKLGAAPDIVFTSEAYGIDYAEHLGCVHVMVDHDRVRYPCSATAIWADPVANWQFLPKVVRPYFVRRVTLVGAESTGKSELAKALAKILQTVWIPEYGRLYAEAKLFLTDYTTGWESDEFEFIAEQHQVLTTKLLQRCQGYLISDTDAFMTRMWHRRYLGWDIPSLEPLIHQQRSDLYVLAGDDIPFHQDGTRDGEHIRHEMHTEIEHEVVTRNWPYVAVSGTIAERVEQVLVALKNLPSLVAHR